MRLIPVIDVLKGVVVRGVGGRRQEYKPIVSKLTSSTDPVEVASVIVEAFRPRELYLADLDALCGKAPAIEVYLRILRLGVELWVDAGIVDADSASRVAESGCTVVAGLETIPGPEQLGEIVSAIGAERLLFSLDLRDGELLRDWRAGGVSSPIAAPVNDPGKPSGGLHSPLAVAEQVVGLGINRLIVLDLARVGGGAGTGTDGLCRQIASTYPLANVFAGGGISGPDDLNRLEACGVKGALVASALHDGRLSGYLRHS